MTTSQKNAKDFERLLGEHRGIVFKLANAYAPGSGERDDLAQEIRLQLWRSFPAYDRDRRFSTWMYRVALNTAISYARSARIRGDRSLPLQDSRVEAIAVPPSQQDDVLLDRLYRSLRELRELDRALVLLFLEDRSYREIAEVLGISESNVGAKLSRIKGKLRRQMTRNEETDHGQR